MGSYPFASGSCLNFAANIPSDPLLPKKDGVTIIRTPHHTKDKKGNVPRFSYFLVCCGVIDLSSLHLSFSEKWIFYPALVTQSALARDLGRIYGWKSGMCGSMRTIGMCYANEFRGRR